MSTFAKNQQKSSVFQNESLGGFCAGFGLYRGFTGALFHE
jgi:hypothetical protein